MSCFHSSLHLQIALAQQGYAIPRSCRNQPVFSVRIRPSFRYFFTDYALRHVFQVSAAKITWRATASFIVERDRSH